MGMNAMNQTMAGLSGLQTEADVAKTQMPQSAPAEPAAGAAEPADGWKCECGHTNTGKFCSECGKPRPVQEESWVCECGHINVGKFCSECGKPRPAKEWTCDCGQVNTGKFCSNCGKARN